ncbi:MAG TPA: hypothetical protein VMP42_04515 [Actinomycetota bacterium]|nr:hypothetical protein [Actinomycetota bacterium]
MADGFDWQRLSMGTKGLLISGAVLIISLFLPWQGVNFGGPFGGFSVNGFRGLGILVFLLALGVIIWELVIAMTTVNTGTMSPAMISAAGGGLAALLTIIHFLTNLTAVTWGAFVGLLAGLAMAYAAWLRFNESKTAPAPPPAPPPAA